MVQEDPPCQFLQRRKTGGMLNHLDTTEHVVSTFINASWALSFNLIQVSYYMSLWAQDSNIICTGDRPRRPLARDLQLIYVPCSPFLDIFIKAFLAFFPQISAILVIVLCRKAKGSETSSCSYLHCVLYLEETGLVFGDKCCPHIRPYLSTVEDQVVINLESAGSSCFIPILM